MKDQLPTVVRCRVNEITLEICHGEIDDIFRKLWFGPIVHPELPDVKATDEEFENWRNRYALSSDFMADVLLEEAQCD